MRALMVCGMIGVAAWLGGCAALKGSAPGGAASGGGPAGVAGTAKPTGEVLARVGDAEITDAMLEHRISLLSQRMMGRFDSPAARKNLLERMVDQEVVYREAVREGLDKDPETLIRLEEYRKGVSAEMLRLKYVGGIKASDAELRAEYDAQGDRYVTPKQVKVSQILLTWEKNAPPKTIAAIEKDARGILERAKRGEDFGGLAKNYSLDQTSAPKGGDIGFVSRRDLPPPAYAAAMALEKPGDLSGLVKSGDEIRILKATGVAPEKKKPFEEVRPWLERQVLSRKQREAWMKYLDELKKKERVEVYESKIPGVGQASPSGTAGGGAPSAGMRMPPSAR